ncbi:ABC transporter G family member 2 [Hibiscus syriacus]|uniref:ABC transporter G family member 2 n=1 Tax=Hibiscus syriacus TaxID=106335 RepID=A0A6A3CB78_HIBSY|nr:ABC transporter G family member 2 [Hibiscus syriacus]
MGLMIPFCGKNGDELDSNGVNTKILLNGISGEAREGEIIAVLGASGSGKSTLIDALANRIAKDSLKGTSTLNGEELESRLLRVISAYVMQDDLLFPTLTVEETLIAAKTVMGDEGHRGVSGGERRRVSIGIDITHDPIVFGSIVIMSIHQPSYRILNVLDRLIFLSHGNTVYGGTPDMLPSFFAEFGHPIPEKESKTKFALDLIRELEETLGGTKGLVEFNKSWQARKNQRDGCFTRSDLSLKYAISASISKGKLVSGATNDSNFTSSVPTFANPMWIEMIVISKRSMLNSRRMPELFGIRLGAVVVTGIILATMFWKLDNSPKGVQERLGFFAFVRSTTFYTCAEVLPVFLQERYIFM